ncbi:MAG: type II toxin-antitoxin system VapC family toxin [Caldilineaceae bacterium]
MIVIDTHIWIWWVSQPGRLSQPQQTALQANESNVIGISAISCWEIAKLVQGGRLDLKRSVQEWITLALGYPGVQLLPLTPEVAIRSTQLRDSFRSDPADELIIATALSFNCPLLTRDQKIRNYAHIQTI